MFLPGESKRLEACGRSERIDAFWCRIPSRPNFGDALTPWLIHRLTGRYPTFVMPDQLRQKYFVAGSIMEYTRALCTVWGSGIMSRHDPVSPAAELLAVRGPLTRERALQCGASCPEIYGDPALLLPKLYSPIIRHKQEMGLIAHFSDKPRLSPSLSQQNLKLIDVQDPIESVIEQIVSCEFIASSSLHGVIVSHAYGIPAVWVQFRPLPGGDGVKFDDYFLSVGESPPTPVPLEYDNVNLSLLASHATIPSKLLDLKPLLDACPFLGNS